MSESQGTILWLSGWSMPDEVYRSMRARLPEFRHASVDYSGADTPETMMRMTEDAAGKWSGKGSMLIAGWSLGASLALRLASNGGLDGLILFSATARFTRSKEESDLGWRDAHVRRMITELSIDRQTVEIKFRRLMFTEPEWKADLERSLPPIGSWTTSALMSGLQLLRSDECKARLKNIECPVYLAHGTDDRICPFGAASELMAELPQARLVAIPDCGHVPFLGREELMADEVRRWWHERQQKQGSTSI